MTDVPLGSGARALPEAAPSPPLSPDASRPLAATAAGPRADGPRAALVMSLRFKVTASVIVILVVALGLVFVLQYQWFHREMLERLGLSSTPLSDVIKGSLRHAMQTRDLSELAAIIDNVSRQDGVIKVFLVDKRGDIKFSPVKSEIGTRVALSDATCQICHQVRPENRKRTVILTTPSGERVFRNVNPIANEADCQACHSRGDKLNGVLISDFSMAEIDRQLAQKFRQMALALLAAVGLTALTITVMMNRLVIGRLERLVHATKLLGQGKLDLAVETGHPDELGELATSFNQMVVSLRRGKEVREHKELLENVLNNVDDSVVVFAPDGTVLAWNRGSELAFGLGAAETVGRPCQPLGDDQAALLARARDGGACAAELRLRSAGGRYFPAVVHVAPLRSETGELLASVVVAQDLTEEKVKERLQQQLVHTEKLAAMGRLAAGVAHELNNPLGNVLLYAELLLEGLPPTAGEHRNAQHIVDNTLRCKAIVRSLLDYARRSDVRMASADLNALAEASLGLVAGALAAHGVEGRLALDAGLPRVRCDGGQIQQMLVNLLQNGIEATAPGGHVTVFTERTPEGDAVLVGVRDDGRGVPPDTLSRLFEPFYTTKAQGTGLGLSICYGIVERHGGRIWVESAGEGPGRGATVFVRLPLGGAAA